MFRSVFLKKIILPYYLCASSSASFPLFCTSLLHRFSVRAPCRFLHSVFFVTGRVGELHSGNFLFFSCMTRPPSPLLPLPSDPQVYYFLHICFLLVSFHPSAVCYWPESIYALRPPVSFCSVCHAVRTSQLSSAPFQLALRFEAFDAAKWCLCHTPSSPPVTWKRTDATKKISRRIRIYTIQILMTKCGHV